MTSSNWFVDPAFIAPSLGNYRLRAASPLIDLADTALAPRNDLDRFSRPHDGDKDGTPLADLGAYEYPSGEVIGLRFVGPE